MQFSYEAKLKKYDDGWYTVEFPDWGTMTEGKNFDRAIFMGADLLQVMVTTALLDDDPIPKAIYGHSLKEGEERVIFSCSTTLKEAKEQWPWINIKNAAKMLGVTPGRVHQLIASGALHSMKDEFFTFVLLEDVENRLANPPCTGRPKKRPAISEPVKVEAAA